MTSTVRAGDQLAHEVEGLERGGHANHAEEWKDPEPSGVDQPDVDLVPDGTLEGGVPAGMSVQDVEGRSEVAAALGKEIWTARWPATSSSDARGRSTILDIMTGWTAGLAG